MATTIPLQALFSPTSSVRRVAACRRSISGSFPLQPASLGLVLSRGKENIYQRKINEKRRSTVVCAVGEVSADANTYLIAGAVAVALLGTAFPILFSRKDICPECDGAGFVRQAGVTLRANAARKDQTQIVCARCNGLGKLGQIDK
ncbi:PREDICTED: uncharacterized protein LOC104601062 [Nelumbo nucifera]|uniref:Uncharacterized protein n=2 Tax=Nelumbo nucifera TaxID=4432 RepID=A0A822Y2V3_NELNU|nr:PREDICTED: uncharacterized protein LOC104601062 [Nelumbo nucifera]DAD28244.1 TPA_asm: hypothetical protein HUJ06_029712 [Nelumbo nucifera]